jgi:hypothetical protein
MTAGAIMAATALTGVTPASASTVGGSGTVWNYSNTPSPECLAIPGGSGRTNGAALIMWTCDNEEGQQWRVTDYGYPNQGYFRIDDGNGECLGNGQSAVNGARIITEVCDPSAADQAWSVFKTNSAGYVELQNLYSNRCLSVAGGSLANDARVIQWTCQNTADQFWEGHATFV